MSRWRQALDRYDIESYDEGKPAKRLSWYMYEGDNPAIVAFGRARWHWTRALAIWAAYVRRWWADRHA